MKSQCSALASIFFSLSFLFSSPALAQRTINWVGGVPGLEREWNCPKNWNPSKVPNEFSNVCIPDVSSGSGRFAPVISGGLVEVNSLQMDSNASLKVEKSATLLVYNGLNGFNHDSLEVSGSIIQWDFRPRKPRAELAELLRHKVNE